MSYTPTSWQTGDTITAAKLNNMESGIEANAGYWIPLEMDANGLMVPTAKVNEVLTNLNDSDVRINGFFVDDGADGAYFPGYAVFDIGNRIAKAPLTSAAMLLLGYSSAGEVVLETTSGSPWYAKVIPDIFIVTLTPTAQDYSGTMDKSPSDIAAAIGNGMRIMFSIPSLSASVEATQFISSSVACANITYDIGGQDVLIQILTSSSDSTYSTKIFPLTPMS